VPAALASAAFTLRVYAFYYPVPQAVAAVGFALLNASLIVLCLPSVARMRALEMWPLNWMGRFSLQIYLWHPVPTYLVGRLFILTRYGEGAYYAVSSAGVLALLVAIWLCPRKT